MNYVVTDRCEKCQGTGRQPGFTDLPLSMRPDCGMCGGLGGREVPLSEALLALLPGALSVLLSTPEADATALDPLRSAVMRMVEKR